MKKLSKVLFLFLFAASISFLSTSCKKDTCYTCTGYDNATGTLEDANVCEGEDDGNGGTFDKDALDSFVELYEGFGGTCKKD